MSQLDPQVAWFVWGVAIALVLALLALLVRALLRPVRPASPDRGGGEAVGTDGRRRAVAELMARTFSRTR